MHSPNFLNVSQRVDNLYWISIILVNSFHTDKISQSRIFIVGRILISLISSRSTVLIGVQIGSWMGVYCVFPTHIHNYGFIQLVQRAAKPNKLKAASTNYFLFQLNINFISFKIVNQRKRFYTHTPTLSIILIYPSNRIQFIKLFPENHST